MGGGESGPPGIVRRGIPGRTVGGLALSGAPSNVKAAGAVVIRFAGSEKTIIKKSSSAIQFETSEGAAAQSPKVVSAEKTLAAYFTAKCGPITTTPTTWIAGLLEGPSP